MVAHNESLNFIITTQAPKCKHFDGSESLNFRVTAGVAQKNVGRQYVIDVSTCIYNETYVLKSNRSGQDVVSIILSLSPLNVTKCQISTADKYYI
jgi:hypothetical protein